ncbi:MAG: helicase-exonuclease AddAB subunit AddA [Lachnospiraceae bacterium]|nr:helicase-exonuclease AddAB subunit AddA [Lachnospiraceae bacterium]
MSIQYTPDQQKVIDLRDRNILVSAAAGSGKTAVLVERIIRMICDETRPVDVDRLLIVTFTNAAAAEMRERIRLGLERELEEHPDSEHIERQVTLLHNALITTIDSFCLYLIRNHFQEIGLDPAMRVADEGESKLLKQDVLQALLEEHFAGGDPAFAACVEFFCPGGRESVLEQHILKLHEYAESCPWPEQWLEERKGDYAAADEAAWGNSACGEYLRRYLIRMVQGCADSLEHMLELCAEGDGPYMYVPVLEQERDMLRNLPEKIAPEGEEFSMSRMAQGLSELNFGKLPVKKDPAVSAEKRELVKSLRSEVKDTLRELREQFFATPISLSLEQMSACQGPVCTLVELAQEFGRAFRERKQEKKLMDFSDIEHYALEILLHREEGEIVPSPVAREYRDYFREILIDEYQDSNLVQEYLLRAVSGEEEGHYNRFMVGDVKQSIYKFRLARPELFLEKYETYTREDGILQRIDLSRNFRSRREVLEAVNGMFANLMSREKGGIDYDEQAALYVGAVYPERPDCRSELLLAEKPEKDSQVTVKTREAQMIAARIHRLRREYQVTDRATGRLRPARYGDIVILLRTTSGWDEEFKEVLEAEGIPVYISSKTGYFAATEVQELLQLLRVLDNPTQDIPLFGVMKSVFGGFEEDEIALLRSENREISLWRAVCNAAEGEDCGGEIREKCSRFRERIDLYRSYTVYMPIRQLLETVLREHDYLQYVTAMPAGSKRRANVEMLLTKASDFEKTSYFGLFHFVRYIEQLEKYDVDFGEAGALDENADVVRIMSIHKSKGLEFPITFVSGLAKRFNMQDANQSFLMDMDFGLGTDFVDTERRVRNRTLRRMVVSRKMREENLAEELRVLYVALTRAREKLIMTACAADAEALWQQYQLRGAGPLSYLDFISAGSYLDYILPSLNPQRVQVTVWQEEELSEQAVREQVDLAGRELQLEQAGLWADREQVQALEQRFAYTYSYRQLERLYTKTSVSELKIAAMEEKDEAAYQAFEQKEVVPYVPSFRQDAQEAGGTLRGNAFHKVMELADYEALYRDVYEKMPESQDAFRQMGDEGKLRDNLREFLARETAQGRLPESYRQVLQEHKLLRFFRDGLAWRMWRADRAGALYREQPFVYGISAARLKPDFPAEEKVLIQGIIDAFFIENDRIVVVDYKTDRVQSGQELWNRYAEQLRYYEEALGKLMGLPVGEKILYSSSLGCCVTEP